MSQLILHVNAMSAKVEDLAGLPVPPATETWQPVSHADFDALVRQAIADAGIEISQAEYGLSKPDEGYRHRLFGIYHTRDEILEGEVGAAIGFRNSTDQTLSAGLVFGSRVFVCDNLAFAGKYVIRRKHTKRILNDLPGLIRRGISQFTDQVDAQQRLFERLQATPLANTATHDILVRASATGVISFSGIRKVREEWIAPSHEAFRQRTAWSLFNAFTEVAKSYEPVARSERTLALTGMFRREFLN